MSVQDIAAIAWTCIKQCADHQPPPVMCVKHQLEAEEVLRAATARAEDEAAEDESLEWAASGEAVQWPRERW